MDKSTLRGMVITTSAMTAGCGIAAYNSLARPSYAEVIKVQGATETVRTPGQGCGTCW
jgi:uncharacterized protein YcfJ